MGCCVSTRGIHDDPSRRRTPKAQSLDRKPDPSQIPFFPLDPNAGDIGSDADSDNESKRNRHGSGKRRTKGVRGAQQQQQQTPQPGTIPFFPLDPNADDVGSDADSYNGEDEDSRVPKQRPRNSNSTASTSQHPQPTTPSFDSSKANVAVMGVRRAGKSRIINTLCDMRRNDPAAASISEPVTAPKPYPFPAFANTVLWEVPSPASGVPLETYFANQRLTAFDLVVVVFCDTLKEFDGALARALQRDNVPFVVVRSKTDQALSEGVEDGYKEEDIVRMIKEHTMGELAKYGVTGKALYCVASALSKRQDHDMPALLKAIGEAVASAGKRP